MIFPDWNLKAAPDAILVTKTKAGDHRAFSVLYNRYHERVFQYLYRILGYNEAKAQDFLQEVFLKTLDNLDRYDSSHKFSTWIFTIAHNLCKNEYRRISTRQTESVETLDQLVNFTDRGINPMEELIQNEFKSQIFILINKLEDEQRSAFILRFQEELSIKEIAAVIGCAEGTIKSRIHYAVKKISNYLKEYNPNYNEV